MKVLRISSRVLKPLPCREFEKAAEEHQAGRHARGLASWGEFVALQYCQWRRAHSLRETCGGRACCEGQLKRLGVPVAPRRSTPAYANEHRPWLLYQTVFEQMPLKCEELARGQGGRMKFRFKNQLMSLNGSRPGLPVSLFGWARVPRTKGCGAATIAAM